MYRLCHLPGHSKRIQWKFMAAFKVNILQCFYPNQQIQLKPRWPISPWRPQWFLNNILLEGTELPGKWLIPGLKAMHMMGHPWCQKVGKAALLTTIALTPYWGHFESIQEPTWRGSHWPKIEKLEHKKL